MIPTPFTGFLVPQVVLWGLLCIIPGKDPPLSSECCPFRLLWASLLGSLGPAQLVCVWRTFWSIGLRGVRASTGIYRQLASIGLSRIISSAPSRRYYSILLGQSFSVVSAAHLGLLEDGAIVLPSGFTSSRRPLVIKCYLLRPLSAFVGTILGRFLGSISRLCLRSICGYWSTARSCFYWDLSATGVPIVTSLGLLSTGLRAASFNGAP